MNLLAPINSLESCKAQIEAGADELYVGLAVESLKQLHFSARTQKYNNISIMPSKAELKEIVEYAHDKNVIVSLTANISYVTDYEKYGVNLEKQYIQYVLDGVDCKVDNVIISDIGLIDKIVKMMLPIRVHSSTILDTNNLEQILFLKDLGVKRAVMSYQIGMHDLEEIMAQKPMEIEIFGYGGCSFSAYCNLGHGLDWGIPCKNVYCQDNCTESSNLLDSTRGCSLCSIWDLNDLGVQCLKIIGRELYYKQVTPLTKLYKEAIVLSQNITREEFDEQITKLVPAWYKKMVCRKNQCKYKNHAEDYYI
ncbi:MAG: U32 family peptidase [Lachnospiraceae bacterium]|nr:U32 family peptidase [Lachnospiraceae bacterium]